MDSDDARQAEVLAAIGAAIPGFEQEDEAEIGRYLKRAAQLDPVRGAPANLSLIEGEEDLVEPGQWRARHADYLTGLPRNCPVTPLGCAEEGCWLLDTMGQLFLLTKNDGKGPIEMLFRGRPGYLEWCWPRFAAPKRKGDPWTVKGFEADEARRDLFAACAYRGGFDQEDRVRGRGAWRGDDGRIVYHAGGRVWVDGQWRAPGQHGRYIYPARPAIGMPWPTTVPAGPGSPGDVLMEGLRSFNWDRPELDPRLAMGFIALAKIGGALRQRPVVYVSGTEGAGKSTFQQLVRWVMNGALLATSNATQAGIYQKVKQDSVAVLVDEFEAREDTRVTDRILELARISYSGDKMQRGGRDGVGQEFSVHSSFMFSSVAEPAMESTDASRMAKLVMRPRDRPVDGTVPNDVLKDLDLRSTATLQRLGRQLLRRIMDAVQGTLFDTTLARFRECLIELDHSDRSADTFATLAAGYHVSLHDTPPDEAQLGEWSRLLNPRELAETAEREATWRRCLTHLLSAAPEAFRHSTHKSVGDLLQAYAENHMAGEKVNENLKAVGLSLSWGLTSDGCRNPETWENARLFVPGKHPGLNALFEGTHWAGRLGSPGPWLGVLRQMPPHLFRNGKSERGLDRKLSGIYIDVGRALDS